MTRSQTAGETPDRDKDTHDNIAEMGVTRMPAASRKIQTSESVTETVKNQFIFTELTSATHLRASCLYVSAPLMAPRYVVCLEHDQMIRKQSFLFAGSWSVRRPA